MRDFLTKLTDEELVKLCNDIWDYQKGNGDVNKESFLYKLFLENKETYSYGGLRTLEDEILSIAHDKFKKIVKVLMCDKPSWYISK